MKEVLYKISGSKFRNVVYHDTNSIEELDKDRKTSEDNFENKRRFLFKYKEINSSEDFYIQNYGNPIVSVLRENVMVVVENNGDKVSIKLFISSRERIVGVSWFKKETKVIFITVNRKTGDVYSGSLINYHKKRKCTKTLRRNYFWGDPLRALMVTSKHIMNHFFPEQSGAIINEAVSVFMNQIDEREGFDNLSFGQRLLKYYLDKRNVKYPNNFTIFYNQPTSQITKHLKKVDNKLVDAFMKSHGLSGKKLKKILHICEEMNVETYKRVRNFFGGDWLNQDDEMTKACFNAKDFLLVFPEEVKEMMSDEEKRRVYSMLKQVIIYNNIDSWSFNDHLRIYYELKIHGENVKWMSGKNSDKDFRQEHLDWSDKLQHYKRGHYERIYPKYFYDKISQPIDGYYPVILDNTTNYNEESATQSNCVKTYIGRPSSFIVSLRKGSTDSEDRVTIEYHSIMKDGKMDTSRIQTLGKYNNRISEDWDEVLLKLDKIVLSSFHDKKYETPSIIKTCMNGVKFDSDSYFDDNGQLKWTFNRIESNGYYFD
jgi:hypothetical protein